MKTKIKKGKFNKAVYLKAIRQGLNKTEAGRKAGLIAKDDKSICDSVRLNIKKDKVLKRDVLKQYEELEQDLMANVKERDLSKVAPNQLIVGMAIVRDKIQLLKGDPTNRVEIQPRMIIFGDNNGDIKQK